MMFLPHFLLRRAERALNALLQRDPATPQRLAPLAGRSLSLNMTAPAWQITLIATTVGLRIADASAAHSPDARLTLTPAALGTLLGGTDIETAILRGDIQIDGDTTVLNHFGTLLRQLDPDLESALAQLIGELPAHVIVAQLRRQLTSHRYAWAQLRADSVDYATEEARVLIGQHQMHIVRDQLDELTRQLERSERRLAHMEHHCTSHAHDNKERST